MDQFLRKQKPRADAATPRAPPPHNVTPAPRAIVRPSSAVRVASRPRSTPPVAPGPVPPRHQPPAAYTRAGIPPAPHVQASDDGVERHDAVDSVEPGTPMTPKPRKRFRKKVNGLFGDQTDLKRRMAKLLRETSRSDILVNDDDTVMMVDTTPRPTDATMSSTPLALADGVIQKLNSSLSQRSGEKVERVCEQADPTETDEVTSVLSFQCSDFDDSPEFTATASRILGSPERLRTVRKTMGKLSPRSNERFFQELQLGKEAKGDPTVTDETNTPASEKLLPPRLPEVGSASLSTKEKRETLAMSPVSSVERTGAPAVLRRKVRRLDRGYRSADVMRARLHGAPLSEIGSSPISTKRGDRFSRFPRSRVRKLDIGAFDQPGRRRAEKSAQRSRGGGLRVEDSQVETDYDSDIFRSPGQGPVKKRKTSSGRSTEEQDAKRSAMTSDPFQMLVEVAAVERKQSSLMAARASRQQQADAERQDSTAEGSDTEE